MKKRFKDIALFFVPQRTFTHCLICAGLLCGSASAQKPQLVVQTGHSDAVSSVAFNPDGRILASASWDSSIKLWDLSSGREVQTLAGSGAVTCVAFNPSGLVLAWGESGGAIKLWDVGSGRALRTLVVPPTWSTFSVTFSPDGRILASAGTNRIKLWDVATGREVRELVGHGDVVRTVAFSADGRLLASGSQDQTVRLWDVKKGHQLRILRGSEANWVYSVAFSPDGRTLASAGSDSKIRLWDSATGQELKTLTGHRGEIASVAFSPSGLLLASAGWDKTIRLWDLASGQQVSSLSGHSGLIMTVAFAPDGRRLASGGQDHMVKLWDLGTGENLGTFAGHSNYVRSLTFDHTSRTLAYGSWDGTVKLWGLAGGGGRLLVGHSGSVSAVVLSQDGDIAASGSSDRTIKVWDLASGREKYTLSADWISSLAISSDGRILASGSQDHTLRLWDVETRRELLTLPSSGVVWSLAFNPDKTILASGTDLGTVTLWDVEAGSKIQTLIHDGGPAFAPGAPAVAFAPDGKTLATGSADGYVRLWDASSGRERKAWNSHVDRVVSVAFSPDGQILASGGTDKTIKTWNVASGTEMKTFKGHIGEVTDVAFNPDGRTIVSSDSKGTVLAWDTSTGKELAQLFALNQGDWVVSDSEGRFDTNNLDEITGLSWVFPDDPFRALAPEIFMRDYYQPKLLPKLLSEEKLREIRSLSDLNRTQSEVDILKVEPDAGGELAAVTVKVTNARSQVQKDANGRYLESGAYDLRLFRDGQLVEQWPEVSQAAQTALAKAGSAAELESWRKLHEIKLVNGEYVHTFHDIRLPRRAGVDKIAFTAYAFNSDRVKSLTTGQFEYSLPKAPKSPTAVPPRRAYLISMGVNANQSGWNLDFAEPSAQDAARLLHDKLAEDYKVVPISLFSTLASDSPRVVLKDATKANLKAILDLLAGRPVGDAVRDAVDPGHKLQPPTPDDAVVLYISSHGYADPEGTFYVVPYDTGAEPGVTEDLLTRCQSHPDDRSPACARAKAFLERTISSREFAAWWAGVDAGEIVMILDSCHSAAAPGREFRPGPLGDAGLGQLSYDKGMRILTATQPDKTARATLVQELGHSLLVQALMEEANAHSQETLAQWLHDMEREVPVLTHRLYPELREADVQLPELFDFEVAERHRTGSSSADVLR